MSQIVRFCVTVVLIIMFFCDIIAFPLVGYLTVVDDSIALGGFGGVMVSKCWKLAGAEAGSKLP